jgi:hypothetical protein
MGKQHYAVYTNPEDGGNMFLRNVAIYLGVHTTLQATRPIWTSQCRETSNLYWELTLRRVHFKLEDGGKIFLRNVAIHPSVHKALQPRRLTITPQIVPLNCTSNYFPYTSIHSMTNEVPAEVVNIACSYVLSFPTTFSSETLSALVSTSDSRFRTQIGLD